MVRDLGTGEFRPTRKPPVISVSEKFELIELLVALAVVNLASEHFRGHGLSGSEMLIGTYMFTGALLAYYCVPAFWDARKSRKSGEVSEGRQDQS